MKGMNRGGTPVGGRQPLGSGENVTSPPRTRTFSRLRSHGTVLSSSPTRNPAGVRLRALGHDVAVMVP